MNKKRNGFTSKRSPLNYKPDCIFCKIVGGEAPADLVYSDKDSVAFLDIYPLNPGHTLVVSRNHHTDMDEMRPEEVGRLFEAVARVMKAVRQVVGADGINIGQSNGKAASQDVFHVHVHIIPRFSRDSPNGESFPGRKIFDEKDREIGRALRRILDSFKIS